jgi:hypothetical protein
MNQSSDTTSPFVGVLQRLANVSSDILEVGELQGRLVKEDAKLASQRGFAPLIALALGSGCLFASLPLIGIGLAGLLSEKFEWPAWQGQVIVGGAMTAIAIVLLTLAFALGKQAVASFSRSTEELAKNIQWIKQLIRANH